MTFYIFMVPVLLWMFAMAMRLRALTNHDRVLYNFCQVRRDTMKLIREHNFSLSREDYIALRQIEIAASHTIHDYNLCKVYMFNLRRFAAALRRLKPLEVERRDGLHLKQEIETIKHKFEVALFVAFFTFTPFLAHEIILKASKKTLLALARIGGNYFREKNKRMVEVLSWVQRAKAAYETR